MTDCIQLSSKQKFKSRFNIVFYRVLVAVILAEPFPGLKSAESLQHLKEAIIYELREMAVSLSSDILLSDGIMQQVSRIYPFFLAGTLDLLSSSILIIESLIE